MMMTRPECPPTPPEIARAPEGAALSILEHVLFSASFALLAANPRVADADFEHRLDRREMLADVILKHAEVLQTALRRYRDAAADWPRPRVANDDPF
jgi:hypothetical protein